MISLFSRFVRWFVRLLFPESCVLCGVWGSVLCDACRSQFVLSHSSCDKRLCPACGLRATDGIHLCEACARLHHIDGLISVYEFPSDRILDVIHAFKYKRLFRLVSFFADDFVQRFVHLPSDVQQEVQNGCLVPVPLYWKRHFDRGANQSLIFCQQITERFGIPVVDIVRRNRSTQQQARLHRTQRIKNVENAFTLSLRGFCHTAGPIILVDDVWTSGSTLTAVASTLRKEFGDAYPVYALVLLRK